MTTREGVFLGASGYLLVLLDALDTGDLFRTTGAATAESVAHRSQSMQCHCCLSLQKCNLRVAQSNLLGPEVPRQPPVSQPACGSYDTESEGEYINALYKK